MLISVDIFDCDKKLIIFPLDLWHGRKCELRIAECGLQTTDCGLRIAEYGVRKRQSAGRAQLYFD